MPFVIQFYLLVMLRSVICISHWLFLKDVTDIVIGVLIILFLVIITSLIAFYDTHIYWENAHFHWKNQKPEGRYNIRSVIVMIYTVIISLSEYR